MKRTFSKYLAIILILTMLMPTAAYANSNNTRVSDTDISGHWAEEDFAAWIEKDLIKGYGNGVYEPNQSITRAEFITLINRIFNFVETSHYSFSDISAKDSFYSEVMKAVTAGYLKGYSDGTVRPGNMITRQEAAVMLAQVFQLKDNTESGTKLTDLNGLPDWSKTAVLTLINEGYVNGFPDLTFRANSKITRAEALVMMNNISGEILNQAGEYTDVISKNMIVNRADITLKNATIKGNLYLTEGIAEGDVTLDNVNVLGEVIVTGGGVNSITVKDSTIARMIVNKKNGNMRIVAKGKTNIEQVFVLSGVKLEEEASQEGKGFIKVILQKDLADHSTIQLIGDFDDVEVLSLTEAQISLLKGLIKKLVLNQQVTLHVDENGVIDEVIITVDKQISLSGKGKVHSTDARLIRQKEEVTPSSNPNPNLDPSPSPSITFTNVSVHDPSVIKDGDTYYVFGSHIEAAKSTDLMNWNRFTNGYTTPNNVIFGDLSQNLAGSFAWAGENDSDSKGGYSVWAPDVFWNERFKNEDGTNGAFMMYYSASSTYIRSAIGFAVSKTIEGPYTYGDTVVYSGFTQDEAYDANSVVNKKWSNTNIKALTDNGTLTGISTNWFNKNGSFNNTTFPNAIDATLFEDADGKLWMTYGSWSGGIFLLELDPVTGEALYPGEDGLTEDGRLIDRYFGTKIAGGYTKSGEGPFIVYDKNSGYYFLNVTYGWLGADGGYNMRQFRATSPDGPYLDASGKNAVLPSNTDNAAYGVKLIGNFLFKREIGDPGTGLGYGYVSSGHNSVYYDEKLEKNFLLFHTRFPQKGEAHELRVHQMFMNKNGWPVVAPYRYAGETIKAVQTNDLIGDYKFVNHGLAYSGNITNSVAIHLNEDKTITGDVTGTWNMTNDYEAEIIVDGVTFDGVFVRLWDPDLERETMTFTAISSAGEAVWGIKQSDKLDNEIVLDVKNALSLGDTSIVMSNLNLPTKAARNTVISWTSSDSNIVSETGVIYPPAVGEEKLTATLTATITKGNDSDVKTFSIVVAPVDPSYGLKAKYSFENDLTDSSGHFGEGTVTGDEIDKQGGTISYSSGVTGNAAKFDGVSGIKLPNGLIAGKQYSVSMWLNPEEFTPFSTTFFGGSSDKWISLLPQSWDNNTMLWSGSQSWYDGTTSSRIRAKQWTHVAFTVDGDAVNIYVNGVKKFSGIGFPDVFTSENGTFSLGVNWWDKPFKGMIDEVRIYNIPISTDVIAILAKELLPVEEVQPAKLAAKFSFENNLADSVGSFGAGTVIGKKIGVSEGGAISYKSGIHGDAVVFNGDTGILLPSGLIEGDKYSVSMWIYAEQLAPYSTAFFGAQTTDSWISFLPKGNDAVKNNSMLWSGTAWYDAGTGVNTVEKEWTHIAFTVNGDRLIIYVNGEVKYTGIGFPDVFTKAGGTFALGVNWWDVPFKGMMDELHIYKGVITANDVASLALRT